MPVYKNNKTGKWDYQFTFTRNGERRNIKKRGFRTKAEATHAEAQRRIDLQNEKVEKKDFTYLNFEQLYKNKLQATLKISTYRKNEDIIKLHIRPYFKDKKMNELTKLEIQEWYNITTNKDLSINRKNQIIGLFRRMLEYAIPLLDIDQSLTLPLDSIIKIEAKEDKNFWTQNEFEKFISVIGDQFWRTFFIVLYTTGLRLGEIQALKWADLLETKELNINKSLTFPGNGTMIEVTPKTKNSFRKVLLSEDVYDLLLQLRYKSKYNRDEHYIFGGDSYLPRTTIRRWLNKYCKVSGVKQITIHEFRHSNASLLISKGAEPHLVAKRLGHTPTETLNNYGHLYPNRQTKLIDLINIKI